MDDMRMNQSTLSRPCAWRTGAALSQEVESARVGSDQPIASLTARPGRKYSQITALGKLGVRLRRLATHASTTAFRHRGRSDAFQATIKHILLP